MAQHPKRLNKNLSEQILDFCRHVAGSCKITAAFICSDYALGLISPKVAIEVSLVIRNFQPRLMNYVKVFDRRNVAVFAADEWVFERDVDRGFLGEALAGGLIFPYIPLINEDYLRIQEVKLKKRLILELLESLALNFPELSQEIYIEPKYFMYEAMLSRARLFPPIIYSMLNFMRQDDREKREKLVLNGYLEALEQLETDKIISFLDGYVRIPKKFIVNARSKKVLFPTFSKTVPRALFTSLLRIFPQILNAMSQNAEILLKLQKGIERGETQVARCLIDPKKYLYVPTAHGLVSLAGRGDIEVFARKVLAAGKDAKVKIEEIGGVLNEAYLIKIVSNGMERKAVVKQFKDWSSFKWFPLALWTIGARAFAVLGRSRLEREYAINRFLRSKGFSVPKILHIGLDERLIFMEYVEGYCLDKVIKKIANSKTANEAEKELKTIMKVGETFAKVHALDVSLGDTKPENIIIGKKGEIYLLDLEQASRNGDKVWDIAEFLYYSGHYIPPLFGKRTAELIAKAYINGYLRAGGSIDAIKKAGNPKYTRVFSIFVSPVVIFTISNICRKAEMISRG